MSHEQFPYRSIWRYLEETGVLEKGTDDEIKAAKREYWKLYRNHYRNTYRTENREVSIAIPAKKYVALTDHCQELGITIPQFLRSKIDVALATPSGTMDLAKRTLITKVSQIYAEIQNHVRNHITHKAPTYDLYLSLLAKIEELEKLLLTF